MSTKPASIWLPDTALRQLIYAIFISVYVRNFTSTSFSFLICKKGESWLSGFPDISLFFLSLKPYLISFSGLGNRLSSCGAACQTPAGSRGFFSRLTFRGNPEVEESVYAQGQWRELCRQEMSSLAGKWLTPAWGQLPNVLKFVWAPSPSFVLSR